MILFRAVILGSGVPEREDVTSLKSTCPVLGKAGTQHVRIWSKKRFIDQEDDN